MPKHAGRKLFVGLLLGVLLLATIPIALQIPVPLILIESNSMSPQLVRGDIAFVLPTALGNPSVGNVAVFQETTDTRARWVAHRIIEGDTQAGFITKGDNNNTTDQAAPDSSRITPAQIAGTLVTISGRPLRLPLIGLLVLTAQEYIDSTILSWIALTIGVAFVASDLFRSGRTSPITRGDQFVSWLLWLPLFGIFVLSLSQTMISNSTEGTITYNPALIFGSQLESQHTLDYSISNDGIFPLMLILYTDDDHVVFSEQRGWLWPGETRTITIGVREGEQQLRDQHVNAVFRAGAYLPLLPPAILHKLIAWDTKGSAVATASVPAIVLAFAFIWIAPAPDNRRSELRLRRQLVH